MSSCESGCERMVRLIRFTTRNAGEKSWPVAATSYGCLPIFRVNSTPGTSTLLIVMKARNCVPAPHPRWSNADHCALLCKSHAGTMPSKLSRLTASDDFPEFWKYIAKYVGPGGEDCFAPSFRSRSEHMKCGRKPLLAPLPDRTAEIPHGIRRNSKFRLTG